MAGHITRSLHKFHDHRSKRETKPTHRLTKRNNMAFQNDYQHILDVLANKRPKRLPVYEHLISPAIMEKILDRQYKIFSNYN